MAHPKMFDDDDPVLAQVRAIALALPGAQEKISHGRPAFFTTRVHCYYGGSVRIEGEWQAHDQAVVLHLPPAETEALRQDPRCFVPAYLGPSGWIGVDLDQRTDARELGELIEESHRMVAPKRRVARLGGTG